MPRIRPASTVAGLVFVVLLTMMTQIGGGIWLAAHIFVGRLPFCRPRPLHRLVLGFGLAIPLYLLATFIVAPPIAGSLGRTRLPCMASAGEPIMPASPLTCLLNRGYLRPEVRELIEELGTDVAHRFPGSRLTTLEAGFPFIDDFPMPPHLSHRDGLKVDIAFFYQDRQTGAAIAGGSPSPLGYFHYEHPRPGETVSCAGRWTPLRWDFAWFQLETPAWVIDENRTAAVLDWLKNDPRVTRIFIEPYLARRLKEDGGKVRFQGCLAARHDDHIHIEVKNTTR